MTRAWAYCRLSSPAQVDRGNPIVAHSQAIIRFADSVGLDLGQVVVRNFGEFGQHETRERVIFEPCSVKTKFFARPIACELSRRMEAGDSLIVTKLDRLGRNVADCFRALSSLSAGGIAIYVLEFQDSKVPILSGSSGKSLLGVLKSCAGLERSSRSERVRECKAERRMVGLNPGGFLPFVLRREIQNGREVLVSNQGARKLARLCYELYGVLGLTGDEICDALTRGRIFGPKGRPYNKRMVYQLVRTEHQIREAAAHCGLPQDDDCVLFVWWEMYRGQPQGSRRTAPFRRGSLGQEPPPRPGRDDRFMSRGRRRADEWSARRRHAIEQVRELAREFRLECGCGLRSR